MSKTPVEVCEILEVSPHPSADRMALAVVKGWQVCIKFDPETKIAQFKKGDKCIYFPPDCVLPIDLANRLNVTKYLKKLPNDWWPLDENNQPLVGVPPLAGRVAACRLRGMPSEGVVMNLDASLGDNPEWKIGDSVAEHFKVYKWVPPLKCNDGDAERPHTKFYRYTDIESFGNYPTVMPEGTEVVFTEKIHGKNCRVGLVAETNEVGNCEWQFMAGSRDVRRRQFGKEGQESEFWKFGLTPAVKTMLSYIKDNFDWFEPKTAIIVYGELYGSGVQDMTYGLNSGVRSFRLFDISINNKYINFEDKVNLCKQFGVEMVPVLYRGPFTVQTMREYTDGPTVMCNTDALKGFKGREGIVITPVVEITIPSFGRLILKSVSVDYRDRKNATDNQN